MRVAVIQMSIDDVSRSNNQRRAFALIAQAAEQDPIPEVVCLPGCCDGDTLEPEETASAAASETFVEVLAGRAREMGVSLVVGFTEFDGEHTYDAAAWCDADGDILTRHRRICLAKKEAARFRKGESIRIAHSLFGPVGVLVGPDACDGAIVASMAQMGATTIFVPCRSLDSRQLDRMVRQATENRVWVVVADSVGPAGGGGCSRIIDPTGNIVCRARNDDEQILAYDIQLEKSSSC